MHSIFIAQTRSAFEDRKENDMHSIFIAQTRSAFEDSEDDDYHQISHHASVEGAARAIVQDARRRAETNAPGVVTDDVCAAVADTLLEDRRFDARDGVYGDCTIPAEARQWIDSVYRIEEVELLD